MIAYFRLDLVVPEFALGLQFDIVLRGQHDTPMER
jgi:hypothetical protein